MFTETFRPLVSGYHGEARTALCVPSSGAAKVGPARLFLQTFQQVDLFLLAAPLLGRTSELGNKFLLVAPPAHGVEVGQRVGERRFDVRERLDLIDGLHRQLD